MDIYDGQNLPQGKVLFWYSGAKKTGAEAIVPHFPDDRRLVSPFFGRGDCEFLFASRTGQEVIGYDLDENLVALWWALLQRPGDLSELLERGISTFPRLGISQEEWVDWWGSRRRAMDKSRNPLVKAALFLITQQGSFSGKPQAGPVFTTGTNSLRHLHKLDPTLYRDFRPPPSVKIPLVGDAFEMIPWHRDDFLYLDPPFIGKEKLHRVAEQGFDHVRLRDLLSSHRGGFVMSYRGDEASRHLYRDFRVETIDRYLPGFRGTRKTPRQEVLIFG